MHEALGGNVEWKDGETAVLDAREVVDDGAKALAAFDLAVLEYCKRTSSNWLVVSANLAPFAAQLGNTPPTFEQIDAIMKKGAAPSVVTEAPISNPASGGVAEAPELKRELCTINDCLQPIEFPEWEDGKTGRTSYCRHWIQFRDDAGAAHVPVSAPGGAAEQERPADLRFDKLLNTVKHLSIKQGRYKMHIAAQNQRIIQLKANAAELRAKLLEVELAAEAKLAYSAFLGEEPCLKGLPMTDRTKQMIIIGREVQE